jgi:hypothetical protein
MRLGRRVLEANQNGREALTLRPLNHLTEQAKFRSSEASMATSINRSGSERLTR